MLREALEDAFPWVELLPAQDQVEFAGEFSRVVVGASSLDTYEPVVQLVREWRATAEVYANPRLAASLSMELRANGELVVGPPG